MRKSREAEPGFASVISAARSCLRSRAAIIANYAGHFSAGNGDAPGKSLSDPVTALSSLHPLWASDIQSFGPWTEKDGVYVGARDLVHGAVCCAHAASTMSVARELAEGGLLSPGDAVIVGVQGEGRGQLRRAWSSLPGNLHVSVVLASEAGNSSQMSSLPPEAVALLPHALGLHCCRVLRDMGQEVQVKWPNDLICDNKKVGGILVEERQGLIVAGIGINLCAVPPEQDMRAESAFGPGHVDIVESGPLSLWERLNLGLMEQIGRLADEQGRADMLRSYEIVMAFLGREVGVRDGDELWQGKLAGIGPDGGLIMILRDSGKVTLYSGSLFLV